MASDIFKRLMDIVVSATALVILWPVGLVVAGLVWLKLGAPIIYRQQRPGRGSEPFEMLKFRSMHNGDEADGIRLTGFGMKLRSTSLDELPELWNILRGDMSLVGPRPLLMEYLPRYSETQAERHNVRPGLTGLAQVSGRNALSWEDRFVLDVEYVNGRSTIMDLRILVRTVRAVLNRNGISGDDAVTMSHFMGSQETRSM